MVGGVEVDYSGFNIRTKNLLSTDEFKLYSFFEKDTIKVSLEREDRLEGKAKVLRNENYKSVLIFQGFENSIIIMDEGPRCDLTDWKHYNSDWKPIKRITNSKFETLTYSEPD